MLKNYIAIAVRNALRHKGYSMINIFGLAVGMACCMLIGLYVLDELSYDRYHEHAGRIYRITLKGRLAGNEIHAITTSAPMAGVLRNEFPEVENAVRIDNTSDILVTYGDRQFNESRVYFADSTYFDIFSLPLLAGDPATALNRPATVVITEETALKYFGTDDPIGKTIRFNNRRDYTVTAVSENVPQNSHFRFDILASFVTLDRANSPIWVNNSYITYILLAENTKPEALVAKFPDLVRKYVAPQIEQVIGSSYDELVEAGGLYQFGIQALTDIHLNSHLDGELEPNGKIEYVYIFSAIAVFILILACINFMNLATARSSMRAREIGVRKVLGAYRSQLLRQFLSESTIMSFAGICLAIVLLIFALPYFNTFTEKSIALSSLAAGKTLLGLIGFTAAVGLIAGSYPAVFLAAFRPHEVLKGKFSKGSRSSHFRSSLVVFQFVVAIVLIAGTMIVIGQVDYMRNKPLGFDKEQVLVIRRADALGTQGRAFESEIEKFPNVLSAASTWHIPGRDTDSNAFQIEGRPSSENYLLTTMTVGFDFVETLGLEMLAGRSFSREFESDKTAYIVNEVAINKFSVDNPLDLRIIEPDPDPSIRSIGPIIGVVKNFHFESLHEDIKPVIFRFRNEARFIIVSLRTDDLEGSLGNIENTWRNMTQGQPFEYSFLDSDFENLMKADKKLGELFSFFSMMAIMIACLGLLGLASFVTEQRAKEIGIRKVLGASVTSLLMLITREFMILVGMAVAVATPITYYVMNRWWLQDFHYRSDIDMLVFPAAGGLAFIIAVSTVGLQALKVALSDPARSLRDE